MHLRLSLVRHRGVVVRSISCFTQTSEDDVMYQWAAAVYDQYLINITSLHDDNVEGFTANDDVLVTYRMT